MWIAWVVLEPFSYHIEYSYEYLIQYPVSVPYAILKIYVPNITLPLKFHCTIKSGTKNLTMRCSNKLTFRSIHFVLGRKITISLTDCDTWALQKIIVSKYEHIIQNDLGIFRLKLRLIKQWAKYFFKTMYYTISLNKTSLSCTKSNFFLLIVV